MRACVRQLRMASQHAVAVGVERGTRLPLLIQLPLAPPPVELELKKVTDVRRVIVGVSCSGQQAPRRSIRSHAARREREQGRWRGGATEMRASRDAARTPLLDIRLHLGVGGAPELLREVLVAALGGAVGRGRIDEDERVVGRRAAVQEPLVGGRVATGRVGLGVR